MNSSPLFLPDSSKPVEDQDLLVLFAMCIFGEARGESDIVRRAVAQVVLNRVAHPRPLFGSKTCASFETNLRGVILRPGQFSSLDPGDPNYSVLWNPLAHADPLIWERCLSCASQAIAAKDRSDTLTANSDHYFDDSILPPIWASPSKQTVKIGRLNFFRLYLPHPGEPSPDDRSPSSGSSPDASPRSSTPGEKTETNHSAAFLSHGSHHSAKILPELAMTLPARPASLPGSRPAEPAGPEETPAPGPQSPRPSMSSPAPKSLRALICGPRSYPWYGWGRRLSRLFSSLALRLGSQGERLSHRRLFSPTASHPERSEGPALLACHPEQSEGPASSSPSSSVISVFPVVKSAPPTASHPERSEGPALLSCHPERSEGPASPVPSSLFPLPYSLIPLLVFVLLASACSDLETTAYRTLAVTQAEYETLQDKVAESAAHNLINEEQWNRFQVLGHRFIAAHNSAVDAFALWSKTKQPADTARLQAMLDLLPTLIVDINALVDSLAAPPGGSPAPSPNGATAPPSTAPSIQPQIDQPLDSDPSPARAALSPATLHAILSEAKDLLLPWLPLWPLVTSHSSLS